MCPQTTQSRLRTLAGPGWGYRLSTILCNTFRMPDEDQRYRLPDGNFAVLTYAFAATFIAACLMTWRKMPPSERGGRDWLGCRRVCLCTMAGAPAEGTNDHTSGISRLSCRQTRQGQSTGHSEVVLRIANPTRLHHARRVVGHHRSTSRSFP